MEAKMDEHAITIIADTAISLLVTYLKQIGEHFVKQGIQGVSEAAWDQAKQLYEAIKNKLSSQPESGKAITTLEQAPDDEKIKDAVRLYLKEIMASDENFAKEIALILREASKVSKDTIFQTKITGNVEKLVQMGNVYGNVEI
jgi:hypothetical protein